MTFRQFTALATVAQHGNITKAAQAMRISQPSLSKHLKSLEEGYRIRLFSRSGTGIQLTRDGTEFLTQIDPIVAQLKNIEARYLNGYREQQAGPLRVGGTYGPSSNILPSLLAIYRKTHPKVDIVLRSNSNSVIHNLVLNGELEVAVCSRPASSTDLQSEPYVTQKLVAFAAKSDPVAKKRELNLSDLGKIPLIIRSDKESQSTTHPMLSALRKKGYKLNIAMLCDSPEAIKTAVSKKLGVGIMYEDALKDGLAAGVFKQVHISGLSMEGKTYIIFHKSRPLSPNGEIFLNLLRQWRDKKATQKG
jgi:LysR family transcriptional regulator, transcriptional activator of the cysJI operon